MTENITFWNHWTNSNVALTPEIKRLRQLAIELSIATDYHPVKFWNGEEYETIAAAVKNMEVAE